MQDNIIKADCNNISSVWHRSKPFKNLYCHLVYKWFNYNVFITSILVCLFLENDENNLRSNIPTTTSNIRNKQYQHIYKPIIIPVIMSSLLVPVCCRPRPCHVHHFSPNNTCTTRFSCYCTFRDWIISIVTWLTNMDTTNFFTR